MSHANRRIYPRQLRRVQVRFARDGEERMHHGFTKNLSLSGALITAPDPPPRGSRVRIELVGKERTSIVYATVVHAHRMPPELRRFAESAMGVRFIETADLISPFLPDDATGTRPLTGPEESEGPAGAAEGSAAGGATAAADVRPVAASVEQTYSLSFEKPTDFLTVYHRDVVNGGLFVATSRPARLHDTVVVALHLPGEERRVVQVEARVVQVVEPRQLAGGRTSGGMGLELLDVDRVLRKLRPVVDALQL